MAEEDIDEDLEEEDETIVEGTSDVEKGGLGFSAVPLAIGILLTLGTVAIKFSGMDPFMGIENPSGVYGEYFLSGVGVGLVILVIGVAMMVMSKKEPVTEPVEEDEFEEEEEDVEEGICPTCGEVIPIDSEECPECGEELAPPEEEEELTECPICGADVSSDLEECPECGEPLTEEEEEEDIFDDLEDI